MQWSRLKKQVEVRFCDSLQKRVQLHTTRFDSKEELGKFWILLDRKEVFAAYDMTSLAEESRIAKQLQITNNCSSYSGARRAAYYETWRTAKDIAHQKNIWSRCECEGALRKYFNLSIEEALASENHFIKALSMFDARTGKRRLSALGTGGYQHPLVRHFYNIRCEAENLKRISS